MHIYAQPNLAQLCSLRRLHNCAKFGCVISIYNKTVNKPQCGNLQLNFRWPLAAKLLIASKKVRSIKWWHGGPLHSSCKIWLKSNDAIWCDARKCTWCFSLFTCWTGPKGSSAGSVLLRADFLVFLPALIKVKFDRELRAPCQISLWSAHECGLIYGPQNFENLEFYEYYCP